ncbi:hypothetical protein [Sulfuriroseicoccus oceanibius]|uniref:TRASH domain-containing protein n=1 Tax=Sulfuriroseicoccus oceanibius TaxID=2707525 RepID=A0A6B3LAV1_9BACT|nr:hypothetical protein [Sulfuriroseicoccus oceanibius]QQL45740.1 hypothetical protein G3M56_003895 [Sulfuriroseicoccus oceanibius]
MKFSIPTLAVAAIAAFSSCSDQPAASPVADAEAPAVKPYPIDFCVVSGEKLGSMGEPHVITHKGVEVRFCCDHCVPTFEKDPSKYIAKIKAGATAESSDAVEMP